MRTPPLSAAMLMLLVLDATAQTPAELKKELQARESKATDAAALLAVAAWAKEKGLTADHQRLLNKILKLDPNNETAMAGLGYVRHNGEWMPKAKADTLIAKAEADEAAAKGLQKVNGVWVTAEEAEDAKRGIFRHNGEVVSRDEKLALGSGKVRHPRTGELIAAEDLEKASSGLYPLGEGKWGSLEEANAHHGDLRHPWMLRTHYTTILTTLPLEQFDELQSIVDGTFDVIKPVFGGREAHPGHRPLIFVVASTDQYRDLGAAIGAETSVYGAFLGEGDRQLADLVLAARPAVANWGAPSGWGPYYLRHATGLAYAHAIASEAGANLPLWFLVGVGSLAERHYSPETAKFFGQQHISKGGVKDLKEWFGGFEISADVPNLQVEYNVFQAGLVLTFCMQGADQTTADALKGIARSLEKGGKSVEKAIQKLEQSMLQKEEALRGFLKEVIQKA